MRWKPVRRERVRDERGRPGGGGSLPRGAGCGGGGILAILAVVVTLLIGGNPLGGSGAFDLDYQDPNTGAVPEGSGEIVELPNETEKQFSDFVMKDLDDLWEPQFQDANRPFQIPTITYFTRATRTGCGGASSQTGPFYCPRDSGVYVDLAFLRQLQNRFGATGDFAHAYILAHEYGHHIQNSYDVGDGRSIMTTVQAEQRQDPGRANEWSIRLELQADCLAGIWARSAYEEGQLEQGDIEEGLNAAAAVGDDRIQRRTTGRVDPHSFNHGTSEQRQRWFARGFDSGEFSQCNTFSGSV